MKIKVAINGYGNLGRSVERAVQSSSDMETVVVFTRRDPSQVQTLGAPVVSLAQAPSYQGQVDVCICCGGSATDLRQQGPQAAALFNTVDSFDTHADIPQYFQQMEQVARENDHLSMISSGWDPGLFSIARALGEAVLPNGETYTFWGKGVSQGHSDAIRRIPGVLAGVQYTVPQEAAKQAVLRGEGANLTTADKHLRVCYVVAAEDADRAEIERAIVTMPKYFDEYHTTVNFISAQELAQEHSGMPHGGEVIRVGYTQADVKHALRFQLELDSNPDFTGSMVAASARAVARLHEVGVRGCVTVLDIAPALYCERDAATLRQEIL